MPFGVGPLQAIFADLFDSSLSHSQLYSLRRINTFIITRLTIMTCVLETDCWDKDGELLSVVEVVRWSYTPGMEV